MAYVFRGRIPKVDALPAASVHYYWCPTEAVCQVSAGNWSRVSRAAFHGPSCAGESVAMMIVVAVALLNERGEVLVAQRRADQSFPGSTLPFCVPSAQRLPQDWQCSLNLLVLVNVSSESCTSADARLSSSIFLDGLVSALKAVRGVGLAIKIQACIAKYLAGLTHIGLPGS